MRVVQVVVSKSGQALETFLHQAYRTPGKRGAALFEARVGTLEPSYGPFARAAGQLCGYSFFLGLLGTLVGDHSTRFRVS